MRVELTVVEPGRPGSPVDVVVDAAPGSRAEDLSAPLLAAVAAPPGTVLGCDDGRPLPPDACLGAPPLLRGAVLTCLPGTSEQDAPASSPLGARSAAGFLALHVVSGPDSGQVLGLGPGRHRVGRAGRAEVRLEDPLLSREHADLEVGAGGVRVREIGRAHV